MKAFYHITRADNDTNGNPRWKYNVYVQFGSEAKVLRLMTPKLAGKYSKKYDAYILTYHGSEAQTEQLIRETLAKIDNYEIGEARA